ncbi:MAG: hypothetical protein EHM58_19705 [Ignavibacteriae bacterium]|nr:MAG: hypothetical protein EHM58_19705 [Ignavibacteriota bacterium]
MSKIVSAGTCDSEYKLTQKEAKEFVYNLFSDSGVNIDRMISIFDNSTVTGRHISAPLEWFKCKHSFPERNEMFIKSAIDISEGAINECLEKANADVKDVDYMIFVTSTGIATPSIDAFLIDRMKFNRHIKRTPIWGLGCAGGAAGLSRAMEFTKAYPGKTCLLVAVELCSLTFQKDDLSKSNIIATSLFSDGAAAVFIAGDESKFASAGNIKLIDSLSTMYYGSLDIMGWDLNDNGLKIVFSRDIPTIVREYVRANIQEIIDIHGLKIEDIKHYVSHPGGMKVIAAYESSLGTTNGEFNYSKKVLNEHGNMSSPSVLYVLKEFLMGNKFGNEELGLITALGPGFSSEILLFKTE